MLTKIIDFQKHMAVHGADESKPLPCKHCGKRFLTNSALACHVKIHSTEETAYDCPICGVKFQQLVALKEHVHIHRINGKYDCPHCPKVCFSNLAFKAILMKLVSFFPLSNSLSTLRSESIFGPFMA